MLASRLFEIRDGDSYSLHVGIGWCFLLGVGFADEYDIGVQTTVYLGPFFVVLEVWK